MIPRPASGRASLHRRAAPGLRPVGRSGATGLHARVPAVEDAYLLPPPDQPGSEPSLGGVAVSRLRLLAPAATSTHHQRHWQRRVVPVATGIIHSLSRPALLGARPPSGVSLLRKRVGWTAPCPGRPQGGRGRTNGTNVVVHAPRCSSAALPYRQSSGGPGRVPERGVHAARMHRPSAGDSSTCCERRPRTASPRQLPGRAGASCWAAGAVTWSGARRVTAVTLLYARTSNVLDTFQGRRRRLKRSLPDGWRPRCAYVAPHPTVPARGRS